MNLPELHEPRSSVPQPYAEEPAFFRSSDDQITFAYLLAMLRRRLPIVLLTTALIFALGLLWTLSTPRVFEAAADVVPITNQIDLVPGDSDMASAQQLRDQDIDTQIQMIQSREMAQQVFAELDLESDPQFVSDVLKPRSTWDNILTAIGFERAFVVRDDISDDKFRERAINFISRRMSAERVGGSFNMRLTAADIVPERAALIANTYARLFTTDDARLRAEGNAIAGRVLGERLNELRQQANADFAAVQGYRVSNDLLSSSATGLSEQEISTYNQQIASARAEAAQSGQSLASARRQLRSGADNVGEGTASAVVNGLRSQRAQLVSEETDLSQRYLDQHPQLVTVREQIRQIDRQIGEEVTREIRSLESRAEAAQQRLSSLLSSRAGTRSQLRGDNVALVQLADLERQADASQALYQAYLERFNEVMAGTGTEQPNARLITSATTPVLPSAPNWPLMLVASLLTGLTMGCLLAIFIEHSYRGFTTLDDVESKLSLNALGSIPAYDSIKPHSSNALDTMRDHPDGAYAESMRNVLVSIGRAATGRCNVIAITSSIPGEGKTTTAAAMGRALAMANQSVIVVDCDIVRSQLSRMFGLEKGEQGLHDALQSVTGEIPRYKESETDMHILPITRAFRKGERVTENGRLQHLLVRLREEFDFVILDCPPILPIAETREMVKLADQVVMVVSWRGTIDKIVKSAVRQLPMRDLAKTGVVLNRVDMRKQVRFGGSDAASFYKHYEAYYT